VGKVRPRITQQEYQMILDSRKQNTNVLVVGDLHEPFTLKKYITHCKSIYDKYNCNQVVFIGDIIDNHYSSFHTTDPDGYSAGEELSRAIDKIKEWYKAFPVATVILGNHDKLIKRQAEKAGISSEWIKHYSEVLGTPGWTFKAELFQDNVLYRHGIGQKASPKSLTDMVSIVQGHFHTEAYIVWKTGRKVKVFGMQVGCVVLKNGTMPVIEMMTLGEKDAYEVS